MRMKSTVLVGAAVAVCSTGACTGAWADGYTRTVVERQTAVMRPAVVEKRTIVRRTIVRKPNGRGAQDRRRASNGRGASDNREAADH